MSFSSVAVIGAGSWGTAMALMMARAGHPVELWGHDPLHVQRLQTDRSNEEFLPGFPFPENLTVNGSLEGVISAHQLIMIAVPSHAFRETIEKCKPHLQARAVVSWITKGFETESGLLAHEIVQQCLGKEQEIALISGPSFALEVANDLPTAVVVASTNLKVANTIASWLRTSNFITFPTQEIASAEIGGAMKNILAIAAGISDGLGFGANARAALITLGLREMVQLGNVYQCRKSAFLGLAGVGDLVLTCTDDKSRNRRMGLQLGKGVAMKDAKENIGQEVEGIHAAREVYALCQKWSLDMPICTQVYRILFEDLSPEAAVRYLLSLAQYIEAAEL